MHQPLHRPSPVHCFMRAWSGSALAWASVQVHRPVIASFVSECVLAGGRFAAVSGRCPGAAAGACPVRGGAAGVARFGSARSARITAAD